MTAPAPTLAPYLAVARIGARHTFAARGEAVGRAFFFGVLLLIFSQLWAAVLARGPVAGLEAREVLWYIAVTEWIVLSIPMVHLEIEQDVRSGDVAYRLARPVSYLGMRIAEALGALLARLAFVGVVAAALVPALAGGFPRDPRGLLFAVPLGALAAAVAVLFQAAIGLAAFWLQDCSPVYWIWQKLTFLLGGLLLPLDLYPGWLRTIARWSPFEPLLYGPARAALGAGAVEAAATAGKLVLWAAIATALLGAVARRARRALEVNGG
ncbi:MAG: ABC-2 family transporter protein [Planctomycetales bacterium]|nr:ABC-2 family transporter protein [Planctomycetales bacterium]